MEKQLEKELEDIYCGKKVREECSSWRFLEDSALLEAQGFIDDGETEITETMGIEVETDEDNCITDISIYFHTSCWGDSGLGEEDPEEYWDYSECYDAAVKFMEGLL